MPVNERRQHFRIEDQIYFEYIILEPGNCYSDVSLSNDLLGQGGQRHLETIQYFQTLDNELAELTQTLALKEPAIAHYLNLLNAKIDYLVRNLAIGDKMHLRRVNISLWGMSFKSKVKIREQSHLKIVIYTKPKMVPIIVNGIVIYTQDINPSTHKIAIQFESLTYEQEQLLSQHIMHAQTRSRADS